MASRQKWVDAFELANGKEPTEKQIQTAINKGLIDEDEVDNSQVAETAKRLADSATRGTKRLIEVISDDGSLDDEEAKRFGLPSLKSSNLKLISNLRVVAIILAAIAALGILITILANTTGLGAAFLGLIGGLLLAVFVFVVLYIVIVLTFSVLQNVATITENIQFIARKLDDSDK
ncbi:MAG: hypothetical protein LBM27_01900 [Lactobacillaceae bacterium]|jgi:hypothetical protein|nr:hypothetical protein [Lactobacillaceae bacterium]